MNEQAAKLTRWLLATGAVRNVAALLTESFAPAVVAAATIDAATITAYPADPAREPVGDHWNPVDNGWAHPLHAALLPLSNSAEHHVLAGVTSRNEILILNLAAAGYLGIEGGDAIPIMRSWLIQILRSNADAQIAVDDPALAIPGVPRLTLIDDVIPAATTTLFTTRHTNGRRGAPITVSSQAAAASNIVLCNEAVAGIYLANRYWPMWRRMEITENRWAPIVAALDPSTPEHAPTSGADTSPMQATGTGSVGARSPNDSPAQHPATAANPTPDPLTQTSAREVLIEGETGTHAGTPESTEHAKYPQASGDDTSRQSTSEPFQWTDPSVTSTDDMSPPVSTNPGPAVPTRVEEGAGRDERPVEKEDDAAEGMKEKEAIADGVQDQVAAELEPRSQSPVGNPHRPVTSDDDTSQALAKPALTSPEPPVTSGDDTSLPFGGDVDAAAPATSLEGANPGDSVEGKLGQPAGRELSVNAGGRVDPAVAGDTPATDVPISDDDMARDSMTATWKPPQAPVTGEDDMSPPSAAVQPTTTINGKNNAPPAQGTVPTQGPDDAPLVRGSDVFGLYVLGETYAVGVGDSGAPTKIPAVTRQGIRKPIKALMMLATSSGLTTPEWDSEMGLSPANRRQVRSTIKKLMGGKDPIREDGRGLLVVDSFCDWKEFQRLTGPIPAEASTENLTAAIALVRGAPFADIPDGEYGWRSVELLKDQLLDQCSDAALELARRQHDAGYTRQAYQTARLGISVYPQREDLWAMAAATAADSDRPGLIWDLKQVIPAPKTPELRQFLAAARTQ